MSWADRALPNGHTLHPSSQVQCQMSPKGVRCRERAEFCCYRRWTSPSKGIAFDYYCPACWRVPCPDGKTPEEHATTP